MGAAGSIAEIKSVQFFNNGPGGVAISRPSLSTCQVSVSPCITNPKNGATPASAYVALSGVGTPALVGNLKDGSPVAAIVVEASGTWESVVDVGSGLHVYENGHAGNPGSTSPPCSAFSFSRIRLAFGRSTGFFRA